MIVINYFFSSKLETIRKNTFNNIKLTLKHSGKHLRTLLVTIKILFLTTNSLMKQMLKESTIRPFCYRIEWKCGL